MEMSTALAHEIKNPAAVALAHVNLLRLENNEEDFSHHLNHIEQALNNICDLVRDMLVATHNRSEAYEVDLHKILADILEIYRAAWPDISFSLNIPNEFLPCYGHETSLRMIFSNLIKNAVEAIEASEHPGEIEITVARENDFLNVIIIDNGNFADSEDYDSHEKPHGNGLGLAICRNLANGLGAQLLTSAAENGGCRVLVKLRTGCPSFA
ncbi:MAG: HAMP domain-containing histidine kinase [Clostridiales bacterium]|jgi:two-component system nitrogen regulation sensor histidine kinase NtrY|nr:HAMP domain-containing histidine kinase [Clostridiales bacterium]